MKYLIPCLLHCLLAVASMAQCPHNLDFEDGNLKSWQCKTGTATSDGSGNNLITLIDSDPQPGRHEIISSSTTLQKDPFGNFPTLCPYGGNYSVKLGNEMNGGEAEGISYTFTIPPSVDTLTFTYFYAVVFQDPQHDHFDQPRFFVTAFDVLTGDVINCASYDYVSTASLPGFTVSKVNPEVLYKDWSPVSLQFFGLNGRQVRLEFRTADCTLGGHFGYAYLDVGTGCSNILATAPYCAETNSLILNAPYGFQTYTWYNQDFSSVVGSGQTITFTPPPATTGSYFVDMIPYPGFGCRDTASATVKPLPVPPPPLADSIFYCQFQASEAMTATGMPGNDLLWYTTPTGGLALDAPPQPLTHATDTIEYFVSQKKLFGCESFRTKQTALVRPTPAASFTMNNWIQCQNGNEFEFTNTSQNLVNAKFDWDFGDGSIVASANNVIRHTFKNSGYFNVKLTASNQPTCTNESIAVVSVIPKPVAEFTGPSVICDQDSSITLQDKSFMPLGMGSIAKWSWDVDGTQYLSQNIPAITATHGGSLPVSLTVTSYEGCVSDTFSKALPVRHKPKADFTFQSVLCDNELVRFSDMSIIPDAVSDEYVNSWKWTFENLNTSGKQNPAYQYTAGIQKATIVATSNFGCTSEPIEKQFTVHPKPNILLAINDSCVYKNIFYRAEDLDNTVRNWYWDFGAGLKKGPALVKNNFGIEGDRSFTLLAETAKGCKDTILRKFTIYDNDAYAGDDTTVAKGQPVFLNAHGGGRATYAWTPSTGLSDPTIENPVATLDYDITYSLYSITDKGCEKSSDIFIKRYVGAEIYIPNAFTPNQDGKNDALKVFPVGFKSFEFMAVYNRYGQQVFHTRDWTKGWDGMLNGYKQDAGNYVVVARMTDYNGIIMVRTGSVVLVR